MKFYYLIHTMLSQKGANIVKILSVAIGLLVSCLIFTSLAFIYSYDTCYKDYKNLYAVMTTYDFGGNIQGPNLGANGVLAGAIVEELPDDVIATSFQLIYSQKLKSEDKTIETDVAMGDSVMFETMGLKLVSGYPRKDFTVPDVVYLSQSLARDFYGDEDPIGQTLKIEDDVILTVKGVFKDLPDNVTKGTYKAIVSYPTYQSMGMDEMMDWSNIGGSELYIRILPDSKITPEVLDSKLNELQQRNRPDAETSLKLIFSVMCVDKVFISRDKTRRTAMVMWVLGLSLLLITTFNYSLITIASLSRRAKAIGVHKCSGASGFDVVTMFLSETLLILVLAFVVMIALLFSFEPLLDTIPQFSVSRVLALDWIWVSVCVLLFFLIVGGLIPGYLFSRIPVTQVFLRFTDKNSAWKKNLLFIQLCGVGFVGGLLVILSTQYKEVMTHDMGFDFSNKAFFQLFGSGSTVKPEVMESTLKTLPYVKFTASAEGVPLIGRSERMLYTDDNKIRIPCSYTSYSPGYLEQMKFHLLQGRYPEKRDEILVNEEFARKMNYGDSVVGRVVDDGHLTIAGVVRDYASWGFSDEISPAMMQPLRNDKHGYTWLVDIAEPFDGNYEKLSAFLAGTFPGAFDEMFLRSSNEILERFYSELKTNRNSAGIATVALVLIALMGLVGFSRDEVERRRKEIAIRKVNGASTGAVISLICEDILKISLPAVVIGMVAAWYVGPMMIEDFTVKAGHLPAYFILTGLVIISAVLLCVVTVSYRVANENPVTQLKSE